MWPFPHDAPPSGITAQNPMGTDGFAFVEFAHPQPEQLHALFRLMGFAPVARHRNKAITVYRQGDVDYLVNEEPGSDAAKFVSAHGPCAPSMGFRVVDAGYAYRRALELGAEPAEPGRGGRTLDVPAIKGIGGSLLYLVDRYGAKGSVYDEDFMWLAQRDPKPTGHGLFYLDHLTHNVGRGRMDVWTRFYQRLFNFREIRYFDIKGEYTGLFSRALTSPDGKIRIPINESADERSQIEEYLHAYNGEGIQHIACGCRDIYATIEQLRANGLAFMPSPPDTYYARVDERVPGHGEDLRRLRRNGILIADPSIFTTLTSPGESHGTANVDFVIFPDRWAVAENTFRPPWYHMNIMSEFMGLIYGRYDAKPQGFVPGGFSLHNTMLRHGPDRDAFEAAANAELKPHKLEGTMAFMFETRFRQCVTAYAASAAAFQPRYGTYGRDLRTRFDPTRRQG